MGLTLLLPLGERDVYGLGADDAAVHLSNGSGGLFRTGEANESEAFAAAAICHHLNEKNKTILDLRLLVHLHLLGYNEIMT